MAKSKFSNEELFQLKNINSQISELLALEKQEERFYRSQEKYQIKKNKNKNQDKIGSTYEKEKKSQYSEKDLKKTGGMLSDFIGWISKLATQFVVYRVTEWVADSKNTEKVRKMIVGISNIAKFVTDFVGGVSKSGDATGSITKKTGETFSEFTSGLTDGLTAISSPLVGLTSGIKNIPLGIEKAFSQLTASITNGLSTAGDEGVALASTQIKDGIKELSPIKNDSEIKSPEPTVNTSINNTQNPETPKLEQIKPTDSPDNIKSDIPKLAKGGLVSTSKPNNKPNNIKPLTSLLEGNTNNDKFNTEIKSISPKFAELMKLPFNIIGSGIISNLQSALKDNPAANNILLPALNSIGKLFDVPVGNNEVGLTANNMSVDKSNILPGNINPVDDIENEKIRGLLASILDALTKNKKPPQRAMGGAVDNNSSGWIQGSHQGYPVSLDGNNTSFIGHGTEYVSSHKTNNSSFVIPFDTPATKSNKNLTKTRIDQAKSGGYILPPDLQKMATGGMVKVNRTGSKDNYGLEKLNVNVLDGGGNVLANLIANSGIANKQNFVHGGQSRSGSMQPMEFGNYGIGDTVAGSPVGSVGKTFMPLNPKFQTERASVGAHLDANRVNAPGSAGCLVFANQQDLDKFRAAVISNRIRDLTFDDKLLSSGAASPASGTNSSTTTATTNTSTAPAAAPQTDFLGIGEAFSKLTQMLGLKGSTANPTPNTSRSTINPTTANNRNTSTSSSLVPSITRPTTTNQNTSTGSSPVPSITRPTTRTFRPIADQPQANANTPPTMIRTGDTTNVSNRSIASTGSFNFSSDANRFTALGSNSGRVEESIMV